MEISEEALKEIAGELDMGMEVFYHKETGAIETILDRDQFGSEMKDDELWQPLVDKIESNIDDYVEFRQMSSHESFQVMEDFANAQTNPAFKKNLLDRLRWRKPFRHFKEFVDDSEYRDDWFAFKNEAYIDFVKRQLTEDDDEYDDDFDDDDFEREGSFESTLQDRMNSGGAIELEDEHETSPDGDQDIYRKRLITAYKNLLAFKTDIFTDALNIAMAGDMKEVNEAFEEGDVFTFSIEHLENSNDANLQKLVTILKQMDDTLASLANMNAIQESELE